jgi:hypothetical protein
MSVSVAIITSIGKSLDQTNNIARSNQLFFATESGKEAAFFHHNVRGAGVHLTPSEVVPQKQIIKHNSIGADVKWEINGRTASAEDFFGEIHENEKITIPLYYDNSGSDVEAENTLGIGPVNRRSVELSFSIPDSPTFDFGTDNTSEGNKVLIVWSVSRIHSTKGVQTFIPITNISGDPCADKGDSWFYCKSDLIGLPAAEKHFPVYGIIDFYENNILGKILPGETPTDLQTFITGDANTSKYELSFQSVLPFTDITGNKIDHINFVIKKDNSTAIPKNTYTITSQVDFGDFKKTITTEVKEKPSIGAFDYMIFQ